MRSGYAERTSFEVKEAVNDGQALERVRKHNKHMPEGQGGILRRNAEPDKAGHTKKAGMQILCKR